MSSILMFTQGSLFSAIVIPYRLYMHSLFFKLVYMVKSLAFELFCFSSMISAEHGNGVFIKLPG